MNSARFSCGGVDNLELLMLMMEAKCVSRERLMTATRHCARRRIDSGGILKRAIVVAAVSARRTILFACQRHL